MGLLGGWLDLMVLEVFPSLNDSLILTWGLSLRGW